MLDAGNHILREHCKISSMSSDDIIDKAATLIGDAIRSSVYDLTKYPKFNGMRYEKLVPKSLMRLLDGVIKTKAKLNPDC